MMTEEQARTFEGFSEWHAAFVESELLCDCKAYVDVFTYNRWLAQGMQVQKGQRGIKLTTFIPKVDTDPDSGKVVKTRTIPKTTAVFCRCQVAPRD